MTQTAYVDDFPADVLTDSGVLYHTPVATRILLGMTRGGPGFQTDDEVRSMTADGMMAEVEGTFQDRSHESSVRRDPARRRRTASVPWLGSNPWAMVWRTITWAGKERARCSLAPVSARTSSITSRG